MRRPARIYYERYAEEPATLQRFTRFSLRFDGRLATTRVQAPIWLAQSCRVGGSHGGYTRMDGSRPSRGAERYELRLTEFWNTA